MSRDQEAGPRYDFHEQRYRERAARGMAGWSDPETLAEWLRDVAYFSDPAWLRPGLVGVELGCGAGELTTWLADHGLQMSGFDISATAIDLARRRSASLGIAARFEVANLVEEQPAAAGSVDVVLDGRFLHCIIGPDRPRLLANVFEMLRPGGYFVAVSMCLDGTQRDRLPLDADGVYVHEGIAKRHLRTSDQLAVELAQAGLHVTRSAVIPRDPREPLDVSTVYIESRKEVP